MSTNRFHLPAAPMDGFVLESWRADTSPYVDRGARCIRYVYRLKRTWSDIYPDDDRNGADFEDEWQVFDNGRFSGRIDTWLGPLTWLNAHEYIFATRRDAQEEAARRLRETIRRYLKELDDSRALLLKIETDLGVSPKETS